MRFKVLAERSVLLHQVVIRQRANEEEGDQRAENRKAATDPERPGVATVRGRPAKVCGRVRTTIPPNGMKRTSHTINDHRECCTQTRFCQ